MNASTNSASRKPYYTSKNKNVSFIHSAMAQAKNSTQLISTNGRWITKWFTIKRNILSSCSLLSRKSQYLRQRSTSHVPLRKWNT